MTLFILIFEIERLSEKRSDMGIILSIEFLSPISNFQFQVSNNRQRASATTTLAQNWLHIGHRQYLTLEGNLHECHH